MSATILSAIDKVAFTIGTLEVRWYGIILVSAMILGLIIIMFESKRINLNSDDAVELFLWVIPLAVVFARLFYVLVRPEEYFPWESVDDFVRAIAIWDGGITIIGGVVGGLLGIFIFSYRKRRKASFGQVLDMVVSPLLLGQIIGRLGNFVNQEAFGVAIFNPKFQTFPFAVYITNPSGVEKPELLVPGHHWYAATCFYEMAWNAVGLAIAFSIWRKNKKYPGILGFFYIFWYGIGRGLMEFIRLDAVPITQIMCFVAAPIALLLGLIYMIYRKSRQSFKTINQAVEENVLYVTEVSEYDVKNYKFVSKILANKVNPLRLLYPTKNFVFKDIDKMEYIEYIKPKKTKK